MTAPAHMANAINVAVIVAVVMGKGSNLASTIAHKLTTA